METHEFDPWVGCHEKDEPQHGLFKYPNLSVG
jgi:hypothetical protein